MKKLIERIREYFEVKKVLKIINNLRSDYRVFNKGGVWGYNFQVMHVYKEHIHFAGHWSGNVPRNGDIILLDMQSGKVGVFHIYNMEWERDPHDMFSCDGFFLGYQSADHMKVFNYKGNTSLKNREDRSASAVVR